MENAQQEAHLWQLPEEKFIDPRAFRVIVESTQQEAHL